MSEPRFSPENLQHLKGQEGTIEKKEKAQEMADIEHEIRRFADLFDEYQADPSAYENKYQNSEDEHATLPLLGELVSRGVSSQYIRRVGELMAEIEGTAYDYEVELSTKDYSDPRLRLALFKQAGLAAIELLKNPKLLNLNNHPLVPFLADSDALNVYAPLLIPLRRAAIIVQEKRARRFEEAGDTEMAAYVRRNLRNLQRTRVND